MNGRKIVNQRIEQLRKAEGMTQEDFAVLLGMEKKRGRSTVNNWEQGAVQVKSDDLRIIGETFDVSVDWLLGLNDEQALNQDIKAAAKTTGLSGRALKRIRDSKDISVMSAIIEDAEFEKLISEIAVTIKKTEKCKTAYAELMESEEKGDNISNLPAWVAFYGNCYFSYLNLWKGKQDIIDLFASMLDRLVDPDKIMELAGQRVRNDDILEWG